MTMCCCRSHENMGLLLQWTNVDALEICLHRNSRHLHMCVVEICIGPDNNTQTLPASNHILKGLSSARITEKR